MASKNTNGNLPPKVISELPSDYFLVDRNNIVGSRLHTHTFFEMEFYLNDVGYVQLNNDTYKIKRNAVCISVPTDYHKLDSPTGEGINIVNLSFMGNMLSKELSDKLLYSTSSNVYYLSDDEAEKVRIHLSLLRAEQMEKHKSDNYAELCIQSILTLVLRNKKTEVDTSKDSVSLRAVQYILEHFKDNITLESLASAIGLNPSYFSHQFHKETGFKFKEYLTTTRINYAKKLIRAHKNAITYACFESGFSSYSSFSRSFLSIVGMTPSDYALLHEKPNSKG